MMDDRIRYIADHYGKSVHKLKCCEECAELIQAILKGDVKAITSEMADVEITLEELKYHYGNADAVKQMKDYKLERQLARIREEEEE